MKLYVHRDDIVPGDELPLQKKPRREYVEVTAKGAGNSRRVRLTEAVPDIAAALHAINGNIAVLTEELHALAEKVRKR